MFDPMQEARRVFEKFDADGSGEISWDELDGALRCSGIFMDKEDVEQLKDKFDEDGSGALSFDEFVRVPGVLPAELSNDVFNAQTISFGWNIFTGQDSPAEDIADPVDYDEFGDVQSVMAHCAEHGYGAFVIKDWTVYFKGYALNAKAVWDDSVNVVAEYDDLAECILYVYDGWAYNENTAIAGDAVAEFSNEEGAARRNAREKAAELDAQCLLEASDGTYYVMQLGAADVCDEDGNGIEGVWLEDEGSSTYLWSPDGLNGESFFDEDNGDDNGDEDGEEQGDDE